MTFYDVPWQYMTMTFHDYLGPSMIFLTWLSVTANGTITGDGDRTTAVPIAGGTHGTSLQLKALYSGVGCSRQLLNRLFTVTNPYREWHLHITYLLTVSPGVYSVVQEERWCCEDCQLFWECICTRCLCCSNCSTACSCSRAERDPEKKLASLLELFSADYT